MADNKEKETVDFGIQEMEDYIAKRVEKKAIASGRQFAVECMKYYIKSHNSITLDYKIEQQITKVLGDDGNVEKLFINICEEYNIKIEDYSELSEMYGEAYKVLINIIYIGNGCKDLYSAWTAYQKDSTPEGRSKVMQESFGLIATLVSASGGPLSNIISEQFRLGAFLLEEGTKLADEYNKRYDDLEAIWAELEADDSELTAEEMQRRVDNGIKNANKIPHQFHRYGTGVIKEDYNYYDCMSDVGNVRKKQDNETYVMEKISKYIIYIYDRFITYTTTEDYPEKHGRDNYVSFNKYFNSYEMYAA